MISIYKSKYSRWSYSEISNYVFGLDDPGIIISNVEALQDYIDDELCKETIASKDRDAYKKIIPFIDKLWDHLSLAQQQKAAFMVNEKDLSSTVAAKLKPDVIEMENSIRKDLISLIGIFTALSFLVFGGISSLDNIFEGAKSIPILQILIIGCIWGICMFNLIFVFVFFVAKITGLQLSSVDDKQASFFKRYPEWAWGNFVLVSILAIVSLLYFIDYANSGSCLIIWVQNHPFIPLAIEGLLIVALLMIPVIHSKSRASKNNKD